ncbi:hypothetical protein [Mesorhizobium sp. ES1-3]|uniref:hypothetical protein n=1 Tax=Mesorhizobium sp. ES1-3 TaxID=2876628 RepID=UPI001CC92510|nr:hypothetical protein [Mesorhizobium sp. ES1-3]MBZ9671644.1 hypothetical protein [Mesorhizobium sp. ES1-3]
MNRQMTVAAAIGLILGFGIGGMRGNLLSGAGIGIVFAIAFALAVQPREPGGRE